MSLTSFTELRGGLAEYSALPRLPDSRWMSSAQSLECSTASLVVASGEVCNGKTKTLLNKG